jgi:hypothetical protein
VLVFLVFALLTPVLPLLLALHQDEELGVYRQRMQALDAYCKANTLPHVSPSSTWGLLTRQPGPCWLVVWSGRSYLCAHVAYVRDPLHLSIIDGSRCPCSGWSTICTSSVVAHQSSGCGYPV